MHRFIIAGCHFESLLTSTNDTLHRPAEFGLSSGRAGNSKCAARLPQTMDARKRSTRAVLYKKLVDQQEISRI